MHRAAFAIAMTLSPSTRKRRWPPKIARVEFSTFETRGVVARRRVAFFGRTYDASSASTSPPLPSFLLGLREQIAAWAGVEAQAFAMALINEYSPGAPIGWHRDAPQYGIVAGVSLLSSCRMKFRPYQRPPGASRDRAAPADGHTRDHRRAPVCVPDDGRIEECFRTSHSCRQHTALFGHLPHAAVLNGFGLQAWGDARAAPADAAPSGTRLRSGMS